MDRVTLTRRDGAAPERLGDAFVLDAEHEWVMEGPSDVLAAVVREVGASAERVGSCVILSFGNAVGRYRARPLGILHVRSGKWTEAHYAAMLDEISARAIALPFHAGAPSALPYARTEVDAPDVLYHAFVWLRHVLLEQANAQLIGALRAIVGDPHRRMARDERVVPAELALNVSPRAIDEIVAGVRSMRRVPFGRGLLGGETFPVDVAETLARPTVDTAENRFVKAFLASCGFIVDAIRRRMVDTSALASRVRADCVAIEGELAPIVRHRMWGDVGAMRLFPASSTALQRRADYRKVLEHHILLRMASMALPLDAAEVQQLLDVKDIARLYELWTAFAVVEAVSAWRGAPSRAQRVAWDDLGASLGTGILVGWNDGTEVASTTPAIRPRTASAGVRGRVDSALTWRCSSRKASRPGSTCSMRSSASRGPLSASRLQSRPPRRSTTCTRCTLTETRYPRSDPHGSCTRGRCSGSGLGTRRTTCTPAMPRPPQAIPQRPIAVSKRTKLVAVALMRSSG